MTRVVIAGASVGGVTTARQLRERGYDDELVLLSAEAELPYDKPPLTKKFLLAEEDTAAAPSLAPSSWFSEQQVEIRLSSALTGVNVSGRTVRVRGGTDLGYDHLVIATGCSPKTLAVPGLGELPTVSTLESARQLREQLAARRHVVVVGSGFIALEVAAVASSMGVPVTVLPRDRRTALRVLDRATVDYVVQAHEGRGVRFKWGQSIASGQWQGEAASLRLSDGEVIANAAPIAAVGSRPNVDCLAGLDVSHQFGITCDAWSRTAYRNVLAVGDVAYAQSPRLGRRLLNRHWTSAVNQAAVAAQVILGVDTPASDAVPYFWSDQAELGIRYAGDFTTTSVLHEDVDGRGRVVVYGDEQQRVSGVVAINRPADFIRHQRRIGDR